MSKIGSFSGRRFYTIGSFSEGKVFLPSVVSMGERFSRISSLSGNFL
jgi:hypothetical protein